MLESGEVDALPLVGRTPEREALYDFTFPYLTMHGAIVVRTDTTDVESLADLAGRRVAVMAGDNAEEYLRRAPRDFAVVTTSTFEEALRSLSEGGCDAVVVQRLVALRLIRDAGLRNLRIVDKPLLDFRQDFCFAVADGDRETLALLNEGLALAMADGTFRRLHAKWFSDPAPLELRRIVVGGDRDYPPFEFLDEDGEPAGYNVDLIKAVAEAAGLEPVIRLDRWTDVLAALEAGEIDVIDGMLYSAERDLKFDFTSGHTVNYCVAVVRWGEGAPPESLAELRDQRIVVQRGDIMHDFALRHGLEAQVTAVESQREALRQLAEGRYDCFLGARLTALYWISENGWENLEVGKRAFLAPEYCFAVLNGRTALVAQLNEGLRVIEENGEYRRIYEKWMGIYEQPGPSLAQVARIAALVLLPLLAVLLAVFAWLWTLRKQVAARTEDLRRSEARFRLLVEGAPDAIFVQRERRFAYVNQAALALYGAESPGQLLGEPVQDRFHPSVREVVEARIRRLNEEKRSAPPLEQVHLRLDGREVPVEVSAVPIHYEGKNGALVFVRDISLRKRAVTELETRNRFIETILDNLPIGLAVNEIGAGKATYMNRKFTEIYGWPEEDLEDVPRFFQCVYPDPEYRRRITERIAADVASGDLERMAWDNVRITRKDGAERIVYAKNIPLYEQNLMISTVQDVTERRRAEADRERLTAAIEQAGETVMVSDAQGMIVYVNPAFERTTGWSREEALGRHVDIVRSDEQDESHHQAVWETIRRGETWEGRLINRRKDGSLYTEDATISPVFGDGGEIVNFVAVKRDITEQLALEDQYRQAQKMEALGQLTGGVAHDFNNLLHVINGFTEMAREDVGAEHPAADSLEEVAKAARRAAELVAKLLLFSRRQIMRPQNLDLNETVADLLKMIGRVIGEHICLEWKPGASTGLVHADRGMVEQALMNLCVNARDAMPQGGTLSIATRAVSLDPDYCATHSWAQPGRFVLLSVADTGSGMDQETLEHVFEPFFTTKETGKGTGLGMATVYGIVKQHDGMVDVASEPGKGAVVNLYWPVAGDGEAVKREKAAVAEPQGGSETVLVAEDNESVRDLTRRLLEGAGYRVLVASDGVEALEAYERADGRIDLALLDVVMPRMGGAEAARVIRSRNPNAALLFASGYNESALHTNFVLEDDLLLIQKPYSRDELLRAVRAALDQRSGAPGA